uniref:Uncharacterized protein n=1 Tax=Oryza barthii TaxID=65489 RepID=A0A0D3G253_9ORYZ
MKVALLNEKAIILTFMVPKQAQANEYLANANIGRGFNSIRKCIRARTDVWFQAGNVGRNGQDSLSFYCKLYKVAKQRSLIAVRSGTPPRCGQPTLDWKRRRRFKLRLHRPAPTSFTVIRKDLEAHSLQLSILHHPGRGTRI